MKRFIVITLIVSLVLSMSAFADFGVGIGIEIIKADEISLIINEEKIIFSDYAVAPYDKDGTRMLPLRAVAENLGFDVSWDPTDMSIVVKNSDEQFKLFLGKNAYLKNQDVINLTVAPEIKSSRTFVPFNFFEELMAASVVLEGNKTSVNGYVDYEFDLTETEGFKDIVADVPSNYLEDDFYQYEYGIIDSPIDGMGQAIRLNGSNHSDDMFMGFYKKISGLESNQEYIFKLSFDIGTNVPKGMMGVGGSPGSSVYVKAGIVSVEPKRALNALDHYELKNVDKANQSASGADLKVISNMEKESDDYTESYEYKTVVGHYIASTDASGDAYIFIGTDSGYESITTAYFDNIKLSAKKATEYNKSIIQEANYKLESKTVALDNGVTVSIPEAVDFVNPEKSRQINKMIDEKVNGLLGKENIQFLSFTYSKKQNGLLSIIFNGSYQVEGGTFTFYDVLNIDTVTVKEIKTADMIKQDADSLEQLNQLFAEKLAMKNLPLFSINNSFKVFYEQGIYGIVFLAKDSDTMETMIIFDESIVKELMNY